MTLTRLPADVDNDDASLEFEGRLRAHSLPLPDHTLRRRNRRRRVLPSNRNRITARLESDIADRVAQRANQSEDEQPASDETEEEGWCVGQCCYNHVADDSVPASSGRLLEARQHPQHHL